MMAPPRVYASFDAAGSKDPTETDLRYYFLLRAWGTRAPLSGAFIDVHAGAAGFDPRTADIRCELEKRLHASDALLLILSPRTRISAGWLPWEIDYAARHRGLPIVCAYAGRDPVDAAVGHVPWWPLALRRLARESSLCAVHVSFRPRALALAFDALRLARCDTTSPTMSASQGVR